MASAMAAEPQRRRTSGPLRQLTAPVTSPAIRLPTAQAASSQPATPRMPCSSAKATVVTSAAPKSPPRVRHTAARVSTSRHGIGSRAPDSVATTGRGLGAALGRERERADQAADGGGGEAGDRVPGRRQHRDQDRADDEDDLVEHGLEREGGLHLRGSVEQVGPPGAHAGADLGERRPGERREEVGEQRAATPARRPSIISAIAGAEERDGQRQHPPLAERVDQSPVQDGERRLAEDERRRHRAGQSVGAGPLLHEQHDAEPHHRHGQPGHERRAD